MSDTKLDKDIHARREYLSAWKNLNKTVESCGLTVTEYNFSAPYEHRKYAFTRENSYKWLAVVQDIRNAQIWADGYEAAIHNRHGEPNPNRVSNF